MTKVTMGIDQSLTCTGVVITQIDRDGIKSILHQEAISTVKTELEPIPDTIVRATVIGDRLASLQAQYMPDYIALENLSYGSVGNATRNLAILFGVICTKMDMLHPSVVPPTSLKKFATGNGKATKKDMLEAIAQSDASFFSLLNRMTIKAGKYDLADAYWIAKWVENENR